MNVENFVQIILSFRENRLILAIFLRSQSYNFDVIAHAEAPSGVD